MSEDLLFVHHASAKSQDYFLDIANEVTSDAPIAQEFPQCPNTNEVFDENQTASTYVSRPIT